jgi:nicotinamidase-related amidase
MGTNSAANFNGQKPMIDVSDTAMLLIDHQSGLFQTIGDMPMPELRARAAALAKMATLCKIPVITTASVPQGPNGPLIPEIHENAPHAKYVARKGEINAWDNPDFVEAVRKTGRKQLVLAGVVTDVCVAFVALSAREAGYEVFAVTDASGTFDMGVRTAALMRMQAAGVQLVNWFAVACELHRDWRNDIEGLGALLSDHIPNYRNLMTSYFARKK